MSGHRNTDLLIHSLGRPAQQALSSGKSAAVFGITSRGIFLRFDQEWMIFLSFEKYRGPLTANLSLEAERLASCSPGERVIIRPDGILFPGSSIRISSVDAAVWDPPPAVDSGLDAAERLNLIQQLASDVYEQKSASGMAALLPGLAGQAPEDLPDNGLLRMFQEKIREARSQLNRRDMAALSRTLQAFLGLGEGLTPAGDDFVMGFLLSLNRWGTLILPGADLTLLNENVIEVANRETTTLSANLIECAAVGSADERLIQALDYLAAHTASQAEILPGLLGWGESSGVDALAGMMSAFLTG